MRRKLTEIARCFQQLAARQGGIGSTDAELLERYVHFQDQTAFEMLLWRHGTLVFNVCRRVLRQEEDAEDAFQATFLTLVRKAHAIARHGSVASWLYKVAYRVALQARARTRKITSHERHVAELLAAPSSADPVWDELRPILDEELSRLPERLRRAFVLCHLEGKTNEEAARELGCRLGTIYSRLSRGREMLRKRLMRRGVTLSIVTLTAALTEHGAEAIPAVPLVKTTIRAELSFAGLSLAGDVSPRAMVLVEGVLRTMFLTKVKIAALGLFVVGLVAVGGILTQHALKAAPQAKVQDEASRAPSKIAQKNPKKIAVNVIKPTRGKIERTATEPAEVVAAQQLQVTPLVSGTVKELSVDIGDRVKKGQVLAILDAPLLSKDEEDAAATWELSQARVEEAEAEVLTATAEVESAAAQLMVRKAERKSTQAMLAVREAQLKRFQELKKEKTIGEGMLAEAKHNIEAASARVVAADALIAAAKADKTIKQGKLKHAEAILRTAKILARKAKIAQEKTAIRKSFTHVIAPFDSVVTRRNVNPGDYVTAGDLVRRESLLTLQRSDQLHIVAKLPDRYVTFIERGDPVDVVFDALPGVRVTGQKVARFSPSLDSSTRTMTIEIDVVNPDNRLLPGMYGAITIHFRKLETKGLIVPLPCVWERGGRPYVYIVRDGKAHQMPVTVTIQDGKNAEIATGINESDLIIANKQGELEEGRPITIEKMP